MKKSHLINLILLSTVAVGCTDSLVDDSASNTPVVQREIVVGVGNGSKMSVTSGDGSWDINWESTDQLVGWTESNGYTEFTVSEIYADGRADIKGTISDYSVNMRFAYPYDASFDGTIDLSAQTFDLAEEGYNSLGRSNLYMLSDEFVIPEEGEIATTTMRHLLSYLKLNITPTNLDGTYVVNKAVIKGLGENKVSVAYDYDYESPSFVSSETGDITLTIDNATSLVDGETMVIPFTIVPFTTDGSEEITIELYFDDVAIGRSIIISEITSGSSFDRGEYNDLNAAFDFDVATKIDPDNVYSLADFDGTLVPSGDEWYINDINGDNTLTAADFDNLKAAIASADSENLEVKFLYLENLPESAFSANVDTQYSSNKFKVYLSAVSSISASAFYDCSGLSYVSAPKATTIEDSGFRNCSGLTAFDLSSVTTIYGNSFQSVPMVEFDLPYVTLLSGEAIFGGCENIRTITLGNGVGCYGVTEISEGAFSSIGDSGTSAITLTIREGANSSSSYTISDSTITIGSSPYDFAEIIVDEYEFDVDETVYSLGSINVSNMPSGLYWYIGDENSDGTLTASDFAGLKAAIAAANAEGVSRSPEVIFTALQIVPANAFDCTSTGDATYKANSFSVSLPVATQIGGSAFYTAEGLTSIYTPEVTTVGENALRQCILLTEIDLPMATTVGSTAFRRNDKMTSLKLPILTALGNNVIRDCEALESVSFPEVTTLGTYVFQDCDNLKTVDLPKATVIGQYSFCTCPLLTSLILGTEGTGVTSINAGAFNKFDYSAVVEDGYVGCTLSIKVADSANFTINSDSGVLTIDSSTAVTFESIVEVEGEAPVVPDNYDCSLSDFDGSFSLETMGNTWTIDDESAVAADFDNLELSIAAANSAGVTPKLIFKKLDTMPESAFYSGSNSANNNLGFTIELTSATTISAQAFWRCNLLTAIDADEVKYIGASAFRNSGITTLELPELVSSASTTTTLAGQTFRGGSFQSIILPKVTALGANEFNACANLTYLELGTDVDCSGFTTFSLNTNENSSLYNITSIGSMTLKIKVGEGANFTISDNVLTVNGDEIYTFANIEVVVE